MAKNKKQQIEEDTLWAWAVLEDLFRFFGDDNAAKEDLWEIVKVALTNENEYCEAGDRHKILFMYEKLEELFEAVYVLHLQEVNKTVKAKR